MRKLSIVRLTQHARVELQSVVQKLTGTGQKVRRAQSVRKADADGPNGSDERIAEASAWRTSTVARLRQRFVEPGCDAARNRVARTPPPVDKLWPGDQEARISATRLGLPPQGSTNWTRRLLARQVVAWAIVDAVRDETVRRTRKKNAMTHRKSAYWGMPPEADAERVAPRAEGLATDEKPSKPTVPVLCMDEQPGQ